MNASNGCFAGVCLSCWKNSRQGDKKKRKPHAGSVLRGKVRANKYIVLPIT